MSFQFFGDSSSPKQPIILIKKQWNKTKPIRRFALTGSYRSVTSVTALHANKVTNSKMADNGEGSPPKRARNLQLSLPTKDVSDEDNELEKCNSKIVSPFSPDTLRRQRFLSEPSEDSDGQTKKHDFYQTLQETLEVLRDEAVTSRGSNKAEDHWCHPFEISEHPIEQFEIKKEEINLERQQSKIKMFASNASDVKTPSVDDLIAEDNEEGSPCGPYPFYQRLSISGSDISGVSGASIFILNTDFKQVVI